jgi:hypothetical protein
MYVNPRANIFFLPWGRLCIVCYMSSRICSQDELARSIIQGIAKSTDMCEYLSFAEDRLRTGQIMMLLPEVAALETFSKIFRSREITDRMEAHNRTVKRGKRMGLAHTFQISHLLFSSPDDFMVRMNAKAVIKGINACCEFGRRIIPSVNRDNQALLWSIGESLVITRDRWVVFCRRMTRLAVNIQRAVQKSMRPWPDSVRYEQAASELLNIFGSYSGVDNVADWMQRSSIMPAIKRQRLR